MSEQRVHLRVSVFAPAAELFSRVGELLTGICDLNAVSSLEALSAEADEAHCLLIASNVLTQEEVDWIRQRSTSAKAYIPLVLLSGARPQTLEELDALPADDKVLIKNMDTELRPAIRRQALRILMSDIVVESSLPPTLIEAFRAVCYDQPPPRFLKVLANRLGLERRTLWRQYNAAMAEKSVIKLEDFHEAIVAVRCIGWKSAQRRWQDVADINHCTVRWLRDAVKRRTGLALGDLDDATIEDLQLNCLVPLLESRVGNR